MNTSIFWRKDPKEENASSEFSYLQNAFGAKVLEEAATTPDDHMHGFQRERLSKQNDFVVTDLLVTRSFFLPPIVCRREITLDLTGFPAGQPAQ